MDSQAIVEATKQLIAIPSTADNPAGLQDAIRFIRDMLQSVPGITVECFENGGIPSLLAYHGTKRPHKFSVILHGHVDVVPGQPEQFIPRVKGDRLYGRGAHDMKTAALVMTDVFRHIAATAPYTLGLQIVSDEEVGGYNGVQHHLQEGVRTDFAITGEQNFHDNVIYNAARGICWVEITFTGHAAHGAYVWHGDNAVDKAARFAQMIMRHYPKPDREIWGTTANIASIHTPNTTFNRVPDRATIKVDFRFTAEDTVFKNRESVEAFIHSLDADAKIEAFVTMEHAVHVREDNPYLQLLAGSLSATINQPTKFRSRPAASDSRHFALWDMNVIEYGITGEGPHSDHEYIHINSIAPYMKTLYTFLTSPVLAKLAESTIDEHKGTAGINPTASARRNANSKRKLLVK